MSNPNTPVLVGVGQLLHRIQTLEDSIEPIDMMLQASGIAEKDTGVQGLLGKVQSVRVIRGMWDYGNPARYIAEKIGATHAQTVGTLFGGNQVQAVLNTTASEILAGQFNLVLLTGAEVGYSLAKARKAGKTYSFRQAPGEYDRVIGSQKPEHHDFEVAKGIRMAIQVYPMYENAIRHARGESLEEHIQRVSGLWSRFNDVAQDNPAAWIREDMTAQAIRTPSAINRPVSFPYPKFMNANNAVDMAAALLVCSVARAKQLGIPQDLWVYPLAGVQGYDHFSASVRDNFYTSPGVRIVGNRVMELAGTTPTELDHVDLYSCFPSAVQVAAKELGLGEDRPLTVTGGLTFGGGPINNYVMHSIARLVELIRQQPEHKGLITANGGNLYKHVHTIYSGEPPAADFRFENVQSEIDALPARVCLQSYQGRVSIESYTVMYAGESPGMAHISCLTPAGERLWVNCDDADIMQAMTQEEFCGRQARVDDRDRIRDIA